MSLPAFCSKVATACFYARVQNRIMYNYALPAVIKNLHSQVR